MEILKKFFFKNSRLLCYIIFHNVFILQIFNLMKMSNFFWDAVLEEGGLEEILIVQCSNVAPLTRALEALC